MALKNVASTALFFVQDVSTGLGVTGLLSGNFTSIKLAQDNVLSAELNGTLTISGYGGGYYAFPTTAAQMNYGCIVPIVISSGNYQPYGVAVYTEQGYLVATSGNVTTVQNNITTISGNLLTLQNNVSTVSGNITTVQNNLTTVSGYITTALPAYAPNTSGGLQTLDVGLMPTIRRGTIGTYTNTTSFNLDSGASAIDQFYTGATIISIGPSGYAGIGQTRIIRNYTGSTKNVTVDALTTAFVSSTTQYMILANANYITNSANGSVNGVNTTTALTNYPTVALPAAALTSIVTSGNAQGWNAGIWISGNLPSVIVTSGNAAGWRAGYEEGCVWLDTVNGVSGTILYTNGIVSNPVNTWYTATTTATSLKTTKIRVSNNSTVVANSSISNYEIIGENYYFDMGSQSIQNGVFRGALVSGISSGQGANFYDCQVGNSTLDSCWIFDSSFTGTITTLVSGNYLFKDCADGLPGDPNPTIIVAPYSTIGIRNYRGGINISGMGSTNNLVVDGDCRVVIGSNCSGGIVKYRGFLGIDDQVAGGFQGTVTQSERYNIPYLASNIITSGNAANWAITGLSGQIANVDADIIYVSGLINSKPSIATIVTSGNAAGWNNISSTIVTVSGITPSALSQIVTSGHADGWATVTPITDLSGISGSLNTISGNLTTINTTLNTVSGNINNLPNIGIIISSGNAAGWSNTSSTDLSGISGYLINISGAIPKIPGNVLSGVLPELVTDPGATPMFGNAVMLNYMKLRNLETVSASGQTISNDAGVVIYTQSLSDNGITFTKNKIGF